MKSLNLHCPWCASDAYKPMSQLQNVGEILTRWQSRMGVKFSDQTWQYYTVQNSPEVVLHQCFNCGFTAFEPRLVGTSTFYSEITLKDYYFPDKWEYFQAMEDVRSRPNCFRLLDIGCGDGEFLDLIKHELPHIETEGFEINDAAAQLAREKGHTIFQGDLSSLIEESKVRYDVITLFQVLEHLENPKEYLLQLKRLLSPNGIFIIAVPNTDGPIRLFSDSLTEVPPHHVSRWSRKIFETAMPYIDLFVEKVDCEPLPHYLWDQYLPVLWNTNIWPALICQDIDASLPYEQRMNRDSRINWFKDKMKSMNVRWLYGVPGHTLYVILSTRRDNIDVEKYLPVEDKSGKESTNAQVAAVLKNLLFDIQSKVDDTRQLQNIEIGLQLGRQQANQQSWLRELNEKNDQLNRWSNELTEQRNKHELWAEQLTKLRQSLDNQAQQLTTQQAELDHWSQQLANERERLNVWSDQLAVKRGEIESWAGQLDNQREFLNNWSTQLDEKRNEVDQWAEKLNSERLYLGSWSEQLATQREQMEGWASQLDEERSHLQRWTEQMEAKRKELEDWSVQLDSKHKDLEHWVSQLDEKDKNLQNWANQLREERENLTNWSTQVDEKRKNLENWSEQLHGEREHLTNWAKEQNDEGESI